MVQQTRKIVENYILYKIHSRLSPETYFPNEAENSERENTLQRVARIRKPHNLSAIDFEVRNLAAEYETKYKDAFPAMLEELRNADISSGEINHIFSKISKDLFQLPLKQTTPDRENGNLTVIDSYTNSSVNGASGDDSHVKWGHVIALLVLAGILSVRAVECNSVETVDIIIAWVTKFFETELSQWLSRQGGWEKFLQWSTGGAAIANDARDDFDPNNFTTGIRSVMRVGVLAACVGLGALMMVKK